MKKSKKSFKTSEQIKREKETQQYQDALYKKWGISTVKSSKSTSIKKEYQMNSDYRGKENKIASIAISGGMCSKKESNIYTGTLVKGIATMHKSNAVPVIDEEYMKDLARMRR